jgi:hypothetical protein
MWRGLLVIPGIPPPLKIQFLSNMKTYASSGFCLLALGVLLAPILGLAVPEPRQFRFPDGYLREPEVIPPFWVSTLDEVTAFLEHRIRTGHVEVIGTSAGGRPTRAAFYGPTAAVHPAFAPTLGVKPGDKLRFKVHTFRKTDGEHAWNSGDSTPHRGVSSPGRVSSASLSRRPS